jgi:hypothetical protein
VVFGPGAGFLGDPLWDDLEGLLMATMRLLLSQLTAQGR